MRRPEFAFSRLILKLPAVLMPMLLWSAPLLAQVVHPGNFNIFAEPTAKLQTDAEIPFQIRITDAANKPLIDAKVTLQIETSDGRYVQVFKAPAIDKGVYMAKPSFRAPGSWSIYVQVDRNDQESARTYEYNVPRSTE